MELKGSVDGSHCRSRLLSPCDAYFFLPRFAVLRTTLPKGPVLVYGSGPSYLHSRFFVAISDPLKLASRHLRSKIEAAMTIGEGNGFAIRTEELSRHYRMGSSVIRAIDDVSLSIKTGEFVALLGSSGSGKSTLLNLIAGLDRPTGGSVFVQGRNLTALDTHELAQYRSAAIGMVFQAFNLLPRMTLEENVELPLRLAEVPRSERSARVREALQRVRLEQRVGHRPSELSGGEQQRAAIARALVNRPSILLADEPTGNLDSATGEGVMHLLKSLNESQGVTLLMITHEKTLANRFAERILTLADGKLVAENLPDNPKAPARALR